MDERGVVAQLLECGAAPSGLPVGEESDECITNSALHLATIEGRVEMLQLLIAAQADMNMVVNNFAELGSGTVYDLTRNPDEQVDINQAALWEELAQNADADILLVGDLPLKFARVYDALRHGEDVEERLYAVER